MYINRLIFSVELILILDSSFSVSSFSSLIQLPYRNMYTMTVKNLHTYSPNDSSRLTILSMKGRPPPEKRELSTLWTSENYGPLTDPTSKWAIRAENLFSKEIKFLDLIRDWNPIPTYRPDDFLFICIENLFAYNWIYSKIIDRIKESRRAWLSALSCTQVNWKTGFRGEKANEQMSSKAIPHNFPQAFFRLFVSFQNRLFLINLLRNPVLNLFELSNGEIPTYLSLVYLDSIVSKQAFI